VWGFNIAHHTVGLGKGSVFGLDVISVVFCVWGKVLFHTAMLNCMLSCVGVSVGAC
jgi:hypothetical protein